MLVQECLDLCPEDVSVRWQGRESEVVKKVAQRGEVSRKSLALSNTALQRVHSDPVSGRRESLLDIPRKAH
jgi:hypothetical protein